MRSLEVPRSLPVAHLSHSSVSLYTKCPLKWKHRYIDMLYEPTNPALLIGKAVGGGVSAGYVAKLHEEEYGEQMLQAASDIVDEVAEGEEVDWQESSAGQVKDTVVKCVGAYHHNVAQEFTPETVEEGFELGFPESDLKVVGYIDITGTLPGLDAVMHDVKTAGKASNKLETDPQATLYVASRYFKDGSLPRFAHHQIIKPSTKTPARVNLLTTERTPAQIENYLQRVALVAREIEWRVQTGNWQGAVPGEWWCSQKFCGYYATCPFGGAR